MLLATAVAVAPDEALLERVIVEEEIATARPVSRIEWLQHVIDHYWNAALDSLAGASPLVGVLAEVVLWLVVIGVPLLGIYVLWRRVIARRELPLRREHAEVLERVDPLPGEQDLRAALEDELRRGRPRAALRWAWIWMARRLDERGIGRFDVDVTNREFASSVRRLSPGWQGQESLESLARRSDRLLYAADECSEGDVRRFLREAEELSS